MNQSSGIPKYNAFAGGALEATSLVGAGNAGIFTGPVLSGSTKHLLRWQIRCSGTNSAPMRVLLSDYLLFYALIDADSTDQQDMINAVTLPRYETGDGVRIVLIATAPMTATANCTITYTNSEGVSGRSVSFDVIPAAAIGVCATGAGTGGAVGAVTPFVNLADGDRGVRSIDTITFAAAAGGFICACLVKPIAEISISEINVPAEKMFGFETQMLPEIKEGAYLNFMAQRNGTTATANVTSELIFINS